MPRNISSLHRTLLYYPTINIPSSEWLQHAVLYWDEVASIIPHGFEHDSQKEINPDLIYLMDVGEFRAVRPEQLMHTTNGSRLLEDFTKEFIETVSSRQFKSLVQKKQSFLSRIHKGKIPSSALKAEAKIHRNKTNYQLVDFLIDKGLAAVPDRYSEWFFFERYTALLYMSLLAKYLACSDRHNTSVGTDYQMYEKFVFKSTSRTGGVKVLNYDFRELLPTPTPGVTFKQIVDFKNKRKDNLIRFRRLLLDLDTNLSVCGSDQEIQEVMVSFQEDLVVGISDITAVLKDSNINIFFKSLKSMLTVRSSTVGAVTGSAILDFPLFIELAGIATTGFIDIRSDYIEEKNRRLEIERESPFSYVYYAQKARILQPLRRY